MNCAEIMDGYVTCENCHHQCCGYGRTREEVIVGIRHAHFGPLSRGRCGELRGTLKLFRDAFRTKLGSEPFRDTLAEYDAAIASGELPRRA